MIERQKTEGTPSSKTPSLSEAITPNFFLNRLRRLIRMNWDPNIDDDGRLFVRRAIFSTYMDIKELGGGGKAMAMLLDQEQIVQPLED